MTNLSTSAFLFILSMSSVVVGYISYWILMNNLTRVNEDQSHYAQREFMSRIMGFMLMGLLPAILIVILTPVNLEELGIRFQWSRGMLIWSVAAGVPTVLIALLGVRKAIKRQEDPNHLQGINTTKAVFDNLMSWAVYLAGYEFLFRGALLFSSLQIMGPIEAVALNTALYAFAHLPKGNTETIGAVPFGVVLCWATIETGSIWTAFFLHYLLSSATIIFTFISRRKIKLAHS